MFELFLIALGLGASAMLIGSSETEEDNSPAPAGTEDDDLLVGSAGADLISGGSGADTVDGGAGADTLYGGDGRDELLGGEGNDFISGGADRDVISGEAGDDALFGEEGVDHLLGGDGNDILYGGTGWDELTGGSGDDTLIGSLGLDILDGGAGNDVLRGGWGEDALLGGAGDDTLEGGFGADYLGGGDGNDVILVSGIAPGLQLRFGDDVFGGAGDDLIVVEPTFAFEEFGEIEVSHSLTPNEGADTVVIEEREGFDGRQETRIDLIDNDLSHVNATKPPEAAQDVIEVRDGAAILIVDGFDVSGSDPATQDRFDLSLLSEGNGGAIAASDITLVPFSDADGGTSILIDITNGINGDVLTLELNNINADAGFDPSSPDFDADAFLQQIGVLS